MFLSTTTNGVDAKGRISVPADFRAVVTGEPGIYVWKSFNGGMLDGGGQRRMAELQDAIDAMPPYDDDRVHFERVIFGGAKLLTFDANGRVSLPKEFIDHAGLDKKATFVGLGRRFEIWNPDAYEAAQSEALEFARKSRHALRKPGDRGGEA
jgi:MraZ protein